MSRFSEDNRATLEKQFQLMLKTSGKSYSIAGETLLDNETLQRVLDNLSTTMAAGCSKVVIGSLFSKYYGNLITSGPLYAFSHFNLAFDMSLENIAFEINELWSPSILIKDENKIYEVEPKAIHEENFKESVDSYLRIREQVVKWVFAHNLTPVFRKVVKLTGVKEELLWANVAYAVHWYYEKWLQEATSDELRRRIQSDFSFVTKEAYFALFGLDVKNPLDITFKQIENPLKSEEKIRLRKKCCLLYCLPNTSNCTTCPNVNQEERTRLLLQNES